MGFLQVMGVTNVEYSHAKVFLDAYDTNSSDSIDRDEFVTSFRGAFA